jgi:hypothetical protein
MRRLLVKIPVAPIALCFAGFAVTACTVTTRPQLVDPPTTIQVMRDAYRQDDAGLFLHTLGRPVLREYSEHLVRVGWSEIRPKVGDFIDAAKVVEAKDYHAPRPDPLVPSDFVWPEKDAPLMRVRLRLDNEEEDFLFEQEIDDAPENTKQARGFWIGDRYFVKTEHPSPGTYLTEESPESERTQWRLVFPYYPFQRNGPLTRRMQAELNNQKSG